MPAINNKKKRNKKKKKEIEKAKKNLTEKNDLVGKIGESSNLMDDDGMKEGFETAKELIDNLSLDEKTKFASEAPRKLAELKCRIQNVTCSNKEEDIYNITVINDENSKNNNDHVKQDINTMKELALLKNQFSILGKPEWWWIMDPSLTCIAKQLQTRNYCVIDDFLLPEKLEKIRKEVTESYRNGRLKEIGAVYEGKDATSHATIDVTKRNDYFGWFEASEWKELPDYVIKVDTLLSELKPLIPEIENSCQTRSRLMVTCYPGEKEARYSKHVDNSCGNGRKITAILYLNKDWMTKDGGQLQFYHPTEDLNADGSLKLKCRVPPIASRLVLFYSDTRCPHEVLPTNKDRFAITLWYYDKKEKLEAAQKGIKPVNRNIEEQHKNDNNNKSTEKEEEEEEEEEEDDTEEEEEDDEEEPPPLIYNNDNSNANNIVVEKEENKILLPSTPLLISPTTIAAATLCNTTTTTTTAASTDHNTTTTTTNTNNLSSSELSIPSHTLTIDNEHTKIVIEINIPLILSLKETPLNIEVNPQGEFRFICNHIYHELYLLLPYPITDITKVTAKYMKKHQKVKITLPILKT